jgi:hypothetical protein
MKQDLSHFLNQTFDELENINNNFLNLKKQPVKTLFQIVEVAKYDGTRYYLYVDGSCHKSFSTYEEAYCEYTLAINFRETRTVLVSKEVEL